MSCMTFYKHLYIALAFGLGHVTATKYCLIIFSAHGEPQALNIVAQEIIASGQWSF